MNALFTLTRELEVLNNAGLHTRVALLLFKTMERFQSEANLSKEGRIASCRSVLDLLSLGAAKGEKVLLTIQGEDAEQVLQEMVTLFENRFYEDDNMQNTEF
ncbi:MAG: HPr family phosphocarrier protein [Planctomycetaceae bacterium]|nr:HPr family phosphocarrier protein [Planctomycetaceae bacterium]